MDEKEMMAVIEAILFVAGDPVSVKDISELLNIDVTETEKLMDNMRAGFESQKRGLQIIKVEDTYQLVTRPEFMDYIRQFTGINKEQSLSRACLETLTIIAYKQPVTKADIEQLRGVKCDYSIAVLMERNLIQEAGRLNAPGRPKLYCTTHTFLKSLGFRPFRICRLLTMRKLHKAASMYYFSMLCKNRKNTWSVYGCDFINCSAGCFPVIFPGMRNTGSVRV